MPLERLEAGGQPGLLDNFTALGVDQAQVAVAVAEIQPGCDLHLSCPQLERLFPEQKYHYRKNAGWTGYY